MDEQNIQAQQVQNKNMKPCPSCGNMISKKAKACPVCGAKIKKPVYKRAWFIVLMVIIAISVIAAVAGGNKSYDYDNPDVKITVDTILNEYNANSASAAEKYSDKVVAITGQVSNITSDYLYLRAYDDKLWLYNVTIYMDEGEDVSSLKNGDSITVVGICDDTTIFGDVKLNKCKINDKFSIVPDYDNAITVKADEFVKAYNDNQVNADSNYKGKVVKTTAKVSYVSSDYIVLRPKNADIWDWDPGIEVYPEDIDDFKSVKEGSTVTVSGECYGKGDLYTVKLTRAIINK